MTSNASRAELYRAFIGKRRTEYYLRRFASFDEQGGGFYPSWNWAAFLFLPLSPLWALYRGMHGVFWLWVFGMLFGIPAVLLALLGLLPDEIAAAMFTVALFVGWIGFAMYANALYYKHAQRRIRKAQARQEEHDDVLSYLESKGGTHAWIPVTLVLVFGAPYLLVMQASQDYHTRARVSVATDMATQAKTVIETAYKHGYRLGDLPSQENLGMDPPARYRGKYARSVSVDKNGVITVRLTDDSRLRDARNGTVRITPKVEDDHLVWTLKCSFHPKWCPKR